MLTMILRLDSSEVSVEAVCWSWASASAVARKAAPIRAASFVCGCVLMPSTKAHRYPGRLLLKTGDLAGKRGFRPCQTTHERIRENSAWAGPSACAGLKPASFQCDGAHRDR